MNGPEARPNDDFQGYCSVKFISDSSVDHYMAYNWIFLWDVHRVVRFLNYTPLIKNSYHSAIAVKFEFNLAVKVPWRRTSPDGGWCYQRKPHTIPLICLLSEGPDESVSGRGLPCGVLSTISPGNGKLGVISDSLFRFISYNRFFYKSDTGFRSPRGVGVTISH